MSGTPRIQSTYSDAYRRVNVAGMFGGIRPGGLEAIVYSEESRAEEVLETVPLSPDRMTLRRTIETQLIIDPMQMKAIHTWLGQKIVEYERLFGAIPSPEEVDNKARRHPQQ
jgi:hypothetical protein